jgi:recombinational DNA repair protein (RecF pathway)
MVFEGITVSKIPYKERDLIVKLLLRNGLLGSFYVYGGQGGGKLHKPSAFDVGTMVRLTIRENKAARKEGAELMTVQEHQRLWEPQLIRHEIQAFYLSCLYFEIIQKFALQYHPDHSGVTSDQEGVFSVLSNGVFYLEEALKNQSFSPSQQLSLFMIKLLYHLGIMPDTDSCGYCAARLMESASVTFLSDQGQFSCGACMSAGNEKGFLLRLKKGAQTRFQDYAELTHSSFDEADKLLQYFCHHFHLKPLELKSYKLLFK